MQKSGGLIALIAGVLGVFAAMVTLFVGGVGGAFGGESAKTVVNLGFGGVFFSFMTIISGAIAMNAQNNKSGIVIVISSILGIILGGTLVAFFMFLSLIGGVLCIIGGNRSANAAQAIPKVTVPDIVSDSVVVQKPSVMRQIFRGLMISALGLFILFILIAILVPDKKSTQTNGESIASSESDTEDPLTTLANAKPAKIHPQSKLAEIFSYGSDYTDLQRDDTFNGVKNSIIEWELPVYEVSRNGEGYKIQTDTEDGNVGTFIYLTPRNESDNAFIKQLKTGDRIRVC